jgi:hypothetical protein
MEHGVKHGEREKRAGRGPLEDPRRSIGHPRAAGWPD